MTNEPAPLPLLVEDVRSDDPDTGSIQVGNPQDHHRGIVTYCLIALLSLLILGHYIWVGILQWNGKNYDGVDGAFTKSLPIVSGLVGTAVGYYFARNSPR